MPVNKGAVDASWESWANPYSRRRGQAEDEVKVIVAWYMMWVFGAIVLIIGLAQ